MRRRTLGVIGTLVWDRFVDPSGDAEPREGWGGIAYSLAALSVALPAGWTVRPILKLGADLAGEGRGFLRGGERVDLSALQVVAEPNNRVELRYDTASRRTERLSGGVPPWGWEELLPRVSGCDALFVNFVSGYELELQTARTLASAFEGPIYADLHSLFLGTADDGTRVPGPLERAAEWVACFDAVQLNEEELGHLTGVEDPWSVLPGALPRGPMLFAITMGPSGSASLWAHAPGPSPWAWPAERGAARVASEMVNLPTRPRSGDPTGCGDVWGATMFARLLAGDDVRAAMSEANRLGGLNVAHRAAEGLPRHLSGGQAIGSGAGRLRKVR